MKVTILTIGNELLSGRTLDTNSAFLARSLTDIGMEVVRHVTVGDERRAMLEGIQGALAESEVVVITGGLGPTSDDLARQVIADLAGVSLVEDPEIAARLEVIYAKRGRRLTAVARRQALLPIGVEILPNPTGLAPGLWLEREGRVVCAFPGVPAELEAMTRESLLPRLRLRAAAGPRAASAIVRTLGLSESDIAQRLEDDGVDLSGIELAYLPQGAGVDLRLVGVGPEGEAAVERVAAEIAERFAHAIYARAEEPIEEVVHRLLRDLHLTLAVAESCTGGLLGYRVTRVPGSSQVFLGGVIAYADRLKVSALGVDEALLARHGAVSAEVAVAMAAGACARFGADVGVGVTGIAGPEGGSVAKPVGLVFVGLALRDGTVASRELYLPGDRDQIRERAALLALDLLRRFLLRLPISAK